MTDGLIAAISFGRDWRHPSAEFIPLRRSVAAILQVGKKSWGGI